MKKCKKDFKKIGGVCIPGKKSVVRTTKRTPIIIYSILVATLLSVGGWLMYNWFIGVTGLGDSSIWWQFFVGLIILTGATILGWRTIK